MKVLENKINRGSLWIGDTWEYAIKKSIAEENVDVEIGKARDNNGNIVGYYLIGYGGFKMYRTRIPKSLNEYVAKLVGDNA